ncbi:MAG: N-acetyltransferase [Crocinitomicaceae bacterium]
MYIINTESTDLIDIEILPIEERDFDRIEEDRYFFNWREEEDYHVYKLMISGRDDILGLASFGFIDEESRVEIRLLAVSSENRGERKKYDRIAGCLIGFAARIALRMYRTLPCLSLEPKTELREYYKKKYYMKDGGRSVFCDGIDLVKLSMEYE